jgi:Tfp pilus assembly protein PilO
MKPQVLIILAIFILSFVFYISQKKQQNNDVIEEKPSLTSNLSYKEAENLLSSTAMEENHIMINESLVSINEYLKSLKKMSSNLSLTCNSISFLAIFKEELFVLFKNDGIV